MASQQLSDQENIWQSYASIDKNLNAWQKAWFASMKYCKPFQVRKVKHSESAQTS